MFVSTVYNALLSLWTDRETKLLSLNASFNPLFPIIEMIQFFFYIQELLILFTCRCIQVFHHHKRQTSISSLHLWELQKWNQQMLICVALTKIQIAWATLTRNWVLWTVCDIFKIDLLFPVLNRFVLSAHHRKLRKKYQLIN